MSNTQHLDEIMVPVIEIADGWAVDNVSSAEECDDAYAYLMAAIAEIEYEIDLANMGEGRFSEKTWKARASRALKYKKAALQLLNIKRSRIETDRKRARQLDRDRALLEHIKASLPADQFTALCRSFDAGAPADG